MKASLLILALLATPLAYGAKATPEANSKLSEEYQKYVVSDANELKELYKLFDGFNYDTSTLTKVPQLLYLRIERHPKFSWEHVQFSFPKLWEMLVAECKTYETAPTTMPFYFPTKSTLFILLKKTWSQS